MVRLPVVSTAPSIRVKKRLKVGGVKAPANACSRGRAAPGRIAMRGPPCVGNMGTAIYLHVTSKGVRFVDPNRSREGSEREKSSSDPAGLAPESGNAATALRRV